MHHRQHAFSQNTAEMQRFLIKLFSANRLRHQCQSQLNFSIYYYLLLKPVLLTYLFIQKMFSDYYLVGKKTKSTFFWSSFFKPKLASYGQLLYRDTSPSELEKDSILLAIGCSEKQPWPAVFRSRPAKAGIACQEPGPKPSHVQAIRDLRM